MSLSDKIMPQEMTIPGKRYIYEKVLKEFIRLLKEKATKRFNSIEETDGDLDYIIKELNKLAGEELI